MSSPRACSVSRVTDRDEAMRCVDAWRALAAGQPMRSPEWLLGWWRHFQGEGKQLSILLVRGPAGELVGLAPLYLHRIGRSQVLKLLGSGAVCTDHTTWFSLPGWKTEVGAAVAEELLATPRFWSRLQLESMEVDDAAVGHTLDCLRRQGCLVHTKPTANCWSVDLPTTWDDYLMMLSKSHRRRCRRLKREWLDSGRVSIHQVSEPAEFARGWEVLLALHGARWREKSGQQGVFAEQRFRDFHFELARHLCEQQRLRLGWLEHEGRPVAAEYQFFDDRTLYTYQAGMDPGVSSMHPGTLGIITSLLFALERGLQRVDFLRGDEPYKARWNAQPTACHDVRVWPGRLAGQLSYAWWEARSAAAHWWRGASHEPT